MLLATPRRTRPPRPRHPSALTSNPEVNMLLVGILVKMEVAIALIELTLLTFWNCHKLQLLYPPESSEGVSPLVHKALEGRVKDSVSHSKSFLVAFPPLSPH